MEKSLSTRTRTRRLLAWAAALVVAVAIGAEVAVRLAGAVSFPLYDADARIGYILKANQSGSFLNKNDWVINARHMGADAFVPDPAGNVLLVGDSIVWGGNPYARPDRLGPQLQRVLAKGKVWPISAGSWGLQNEVTYLDDNDDVVAAVDTIAIVSNGGDFAEPSSWGCTMTHPRDKPVLALWYLAKKYALNWPCEGTPPALQVPRREPVAMLADFVRRHPGKRLVVFLYPDKEEAANEALLVSRLESVAPRLKAAGVEQVVSVGRDPRWRGRLDLYKDGIHPTVTGMTVLATVIAESLRAP